MPPSDPRDLSGSELEVLSMLWEHGPSTVRQVLTRLRDAGRRLAYTTVLTFLARLEQKGFVSSDRSGVAYVYSPQITRDRVTRSRLRSILQTFYGGEAGPLVLQLVREQNLSRQELAELQDLIDRLDEPTTEQRPGGKR
jgi:predicted transcriptional regulator